MALFGLKLERCGEIEFADSDVGYLELTEMISWLIPSSNGFKLLAAPTRIGGPRLQCVPVPFSHDPRLGG